MTPTTAVGRALLRDEWLVTPYGEAQAAMHDAILAIEAEAAAAERARLRAAVEGLPNLSPFPTDWPYVQRADVLALLREPVA
jgi:hypothetical protein